MYKIGLINVLIRHNVFASKNRILPDDVQTVIFNFGSILGLNFFYNGREGKYSKKGI